jgi:hypothetical protein
MSRNYECDVAFPTRTIYCSGCKKCICTLSAAIFFSASLFSPSFYLMSFPAFPTPPSPSFPPSCLPVRRTAPCFCSWHFYPSVILNCSLKIIKIALCVHYAACTYTYIYIYICVCVCICVYVISQVWVSQRNLTKLGIIIIIIIFINCKWVDTRWQWSYYICTDYEGLLL